MGGILFGVTRCFFFGGGTLFGRVLYFGGGGVSCPCPLINHTPQFRPPLHGLRPLRHCDVREAQRDAHGLSWLCFALCLLARICGSGSEKSTPQFPSSAFGGLIPLHTLMNNQAHAHANNILPTCGEVCILAYIFLRKKPDVFASGF